MDCAALYKGALEKFHKEKAAGLPAERIANANRIALRAYDACSAGDEFNAKTFFDQLAAEAPRSAASAQVAGDWIPDLAPAIPAHSQYVGCNQAQGWHTWRGTSAQYGFAYCALRGASRMAPWRVRRRRRHSSAQNGAPMLKIGMPATVTRNRDERAEREAALEGDRERTLQHAQHGEAGQRGDEGRRRRQHQARDGRREQAEQQGQHAHHDARGILRALVAAGRDDGVDRAGEAGRDGADEGGDRSRRRRSRRRWR